MKRVRVARAWESLRAALWFVPSLMTGLSIAVSIGMIELDRRYQVVKSVSAWIYTGGAEGARQMLATIAGSMITVAGVSFSVTMVALSLASSQLGPRLLRSFMRDRGNQIVLGTFIATFVYCLMVLRTVRGDGGDGSEFVPSIAVTFGLVLALASLAVLIYFIHHLTNLLQADHVIAGVAADLDRAIGRMYPGDAGREPDDGDAPSIERFETVIARSTSQRVESVKSGYVNAIAIGDLMEIASAADCIIRVAVLPGRYVLDRSPIAEVWSDGSVSRRVCDRVRDAFIIGRNRTAHQDVEFVVEQLVEVAARALSPSINDPFTAIACVDRLSTAILHLIDCRFPSPYRFDDRGNLRVVASRPDFAGIVDAAFNQIRQFGSRAPAVTIRMLETIAFLLDNARTEEQKQVLMKHAAMIRRAAEADTEESRDRADVERRYESIVDVRRGDPS